MKYLMLIYQAEDAMNQDEREKCYQESAAYCRQLADEGKFIASAPLHPTSTATSIRTQDGKRLVTDGPFAETREHLGGFFMVHAKDLDEAIDIAAKLPAGRWGTVEIRPVVEVAGVPDFKV